MREIYDVVTKQTIMIEPGQVMAVAKKLGIDYTGISHLNSERQLSLSCRYILPKNKDKIFTLIDIDTQKEYDCIRHSTLEIYFNQKMTENEVKYVDALIRQKQKAISVFNKVFYMKGCSPKRLTNLKNASLEAIKQKIQFKLQKKIRTRIRNRIRHALERHHIRKLNKTEQLLGCNTLFFIGYIQSQFKTGMTWDNHGEKWHIDHIAPCFKFDLTKIEEQFKCFHYSNLRPLWITTEIARSNGDIESIGNLNRVYE